MNRYEGLIDYINNLTNDGVKSPNDSWSDDESSIEYACSILSNFDKVDWEKLNENWQSNSDIWIECLIDVLSELNQKETIECLVNIVLFGNDESALNAIEHVRERFESIELDIQQSINNHISKIISNRQKNT